MHNDWLGSEVPVTFELFDSREVRRIRGKSSAEGEEKKSILLSSVMAQVGREEGFCSQEFIMRLAFTRSL